MARINRDEDGRFQELARALAVQERPRKTRIADSIDEGFDSLDMDPYLMRQDDDDDNVDSRAYVMDYGRRDFSRPGPGGFATEQGLSFWLPLNDLGDGQVDIRAAAGWLNGQQGTFTRATAATCRLKNGLLKKVLSGVPRSHYLASGAYGGYLAEGARTNICLQSETLGTTWASTSNVIGSEATTAPDGTTTADSFTRQAATGTFVSQGFTIGSGVVHTVSMFFKKKDADDWVYLSGSDGAANGVRSWFNLSTGAVGNTTAFGTGWSGASAVIESWGDGWYRCGFTITPTGTALTIAFASVSANGSLDGTNSAGQYGWGAQLEAAAFASSYIPTTTASATRNADTLTYAAGGSIGQTEGAVYAEYSWPAIGVNQSILQLDDGTNNERVVLYATAGIPRLFVADGGVGQVDLGADNIPVVNTVAKLAAAYTTNSFKRCAAGSAVQEDTVGTVPTVHTVRIGANAVNTNQVYGTIMNVQLWQRALPDAQLQSLTA